MRYGNASTPYTSCTVAWVSCRLNDADYFLDDVKAEFDKARGARLRVWCDLPELLCA